MTEPDAATDRRLLQERAYRDDENLKARQSIYQFAVGPIDLEWRLGGVEWTGDELVLDLGCGNGLDLGQLAPRSAVGRIVGSDLSLGMLHTIQPWASSTPVPVDLVQSDICALPFRDGVADVALAMHMLYHVPDIPAALAEVRRVLGPGGVLLASCNSGDAMAAMSRPLDEAVSTVVGRPVRAMPELAFTTESGRALLEPFFSDVELRTNATAFRVPTADPVVAAGAESVRDPVMAMVGDVDWPAVVAEFRRLVDDRIAREGAFAFDIVSGVFVCRV